MPLCQIQPDETLQPLPAGSDPVALLQDGALLVWRNCLQELGVHQQLLELFRCSIEARHGAALAAEVAARGLEHIHEFLDAAAIEQLYLALRQQLVNRMPALTVALFRQLGLRDGFNVHSASLVRMMTPYPVMRAEQQRLKQHMGKLSLHGPHHDHYQNVPWNALNTWIAVGPVRRENGMFMYTELWGRNLPQGEEVVRDDQYLGQPLSVTLAPGDALLFHSNHLHGSRLNTTGETRVVLTNRICPGQPVYPDPARPHVYYSAAHWPQVLPLPEIFAPDWVPGGADAVPDIGRLAPIATGKDSRLPPTESVNPLPRVFASVEAAAAALPENGVGAVGATLCVVKQGGALRLFGRRCPHEGADMAGGFVEDGRLLCPFHGLGFSLDSGKPDCAGVLPLRVIAAPPAGPDGGAEGAAA